MAINFNTNPYYDDYDQTKGFHKILFKPGVSVQARELTQLQTILNNQITKFGNHVFVEGSLVIPGQSALDKDYHSVKVVVNTTIVGNLVGEIVVGGTTGIKALVTNATAANTAGDPDTLFIKYLNSGTSGEVRKFANSETITVEGGSAYVTAITPVSPETSASFTGTAFTITEGVMYVRGNFVYFPQQTYIISKYSTIKNSIVGFNIEESIKTYNDDNTLLDPAQGVYNYSAPGADRYFIGLTLGERGLTSELDDDPDFIELIRIKDYTVISQKTRAEYNVLADEFARRTYDESGDYVVRPYNIKLQEHLGFYTSVQGGSANKFIIKASPGKAYVKGYEIDSTQTTVVTVDKARDTESVNAGSMFLPIGNYVLVDNIASIPSTLDTIPLIDLKDATGGTGNTIGTARMRYIEYYSGTIGGSAAQYKVFLFDVAMNPGEVFADIRSIFFNNATFNDFIANTVLESGSSIIKEPNKKSYIFPMPRAYIAGFVSDETTYATRKVYSGTLSAGHIIQLSAPTNSTFAGFSSDNYQLIIHDGTYINLSSSMFTYSSGNTVLDIDIGTNPNDAVIVIATLNKANGASNAKAKTLNTNSQITKISQANCEATTIALAKADIYRLVSVKMSTVAFGVSYSATNEVDITSRYDLDNGQRVSHYGLGFITLKKGQPKPTSPIRITFDYFTHGAGDYFSVNSYNTIDYVNIPSVTFDGKNYNLRDCLDFRPRINDSGAEYSGTGSSVGNFPDFENDLVCDYSFYLPKISKIIIDKKGKLQVVDSKSELSPKEPETPEGSMALYILTQDPYVLDIINNITIKKIDNRRYTMRDIGNLETRIKNVEYYVSLNLLELDAQNYQLQDGAGTDLFKNGFVVDSFTGHGVGDVYNSDYSCAVDQNKKVLRPKSVATFYNLAEVNTNDTQRTAAKYKLAGDLILLNYTEEAFVSNTKFSGEVVANPYDMVKFVGIMYGKQTDVWYEYKKLPDVYANEQGDYDSLIKDSAINNNQTTFHDNWVSKKYTSTDEYDAEVISNMRDVSIDFTAVGLKPSTRLYVFFGGINVSRNCKPILGSAVSVKTAINLLGDAAEDIITDSNGEISVVFNYSTKYNLHTGTHVLRLSDSPTGNIMEESTSAAMLFTARGQIKNIEYKFVTITATRPPILYSADTINTVLAAANTTSIVPAGESTETLLDNGLVEIQTVITTTNINNETLAITTIEDVITTTIDPIVISGQGQVYIEPIVSAGDADYPVDHSGFLETMFLVVAGRYPTAEEKALFEEETAARGITDATVTAATFTDGGTHTYIVNDGISGLDVTDGSGNFIHPDDVGATYNQEAVLLYTLVKDLTIYVLQNGLALDNQSSAATRVQDINGGDDEKTASIIALQCVIAITNVNIIDPVVTWYKGALYASIGL